MKRLSLLLTVFLTLALSAPSAQTGKIPDGFTPIFNGKDLKGWHVSHSSHHGNLLNARVVNGELLIGQNPIGEGGILLTDRRYKDFELYLEVKPDWGCDGGIFLRSNEDGNAYQITLDYMPKNSMGAFITEGIPALNGTGQRRSQDWEKIWKRDEWNSLRVRMVGEVPKVEIWMNDVQIVDYQDDKNHALGGVYAGMIALQIHYTNTTTPRAIPNGVHRYRNIAIKELN
jgi:Domain of Unknown Function (DUF1080)